MPQAALRNQNIEKEAWELFEVGSYEDMVRLTARNKGNKLLSDLAILSLIQLTGKMPGNQPIPAGTSVFSPLLSAYEFYFNNQRNKASVKISEYFNSNNPPVCFVIADFSIKLTFENGKFDDCYQIIRFYTNQEKTNPFLTEEIECLFELKKYQELVDVFRKNLKALSGNYDIHRKCGIALTLLGKFKESEALLRNIPGRAELPGFEEKKKEFAHIIREIPEFENQKNLSGQEMNQLGFAYLFNSDYKKAEKIFVKAVSLIK